MSPLFGGFTIMYFGVWWPVHFVAVCELLHVCTLVFGLMSLGVTN